MLNPVATNNNQGLLDLYQAMQIRAAMPAMQLQSEEQQKQLQQKAELEALVRQYNEDPRSLNDMAVAYVKQAAPAAGLNIAEGSNADRGGHVGSKMLGFGVGALDSLLFDLIPDKAYVNRYNKGWSSAGKWASTIASIAIPGIGMLKGASAAKALSAGAKLGSKEILETVLAKNADDVVKIFGKEAVESGAITLSDLESGVDSILDTSRKGIGELAKKYGAVTRRKVVNGKVIVRQNGKKFALDAKSKEGIAALKKGVPAYDPKKIQLAIDKKVADAEKRLSDDLVSKLDEEIQKTSQRLFGDKELLNSVVKNGKPIKGYSKKEIDELAARIVGDEERLAQLNKLIRPAGEYRRTAKAARELISGNAIDDAATLSRLAEESAPAWRIKQTLKTVSAAKRQPTSGIEAIRRSAKEYILTQDETRRAALKEIIKTQIKEMPASQKSTVLKEIKKQASNIAKKPIPSKYKTVASRAAFIDRKAGAVGAANQLLKDVSASTRLARAASSIGRVSAPGMARGGFEALAGAVQSGIRPMERVGKVLIAIPQLGMVMSPAINSMAPMSVEQAAGGPYGMLNPLFAPGMQQANMSSLPYGGMIPFVPGSGTQQDVQQMQQQ